MTVQDNIPEQASFSTFEQFGPWLKDSLLNQLANTWLYDKEEIIYHICDELIKNGFKSNYKFLLIWLNTRNRLMASEKHMSQEEADQWLSEVFFSGADELVRKQFDHSEEDDIPGRLRRLLDLHSVLVERRLTKKKGPLPDWLDHSESALKDLVSITRLARKLKIQVTITFEKTSELQIRIENDAPILDRDLKKIQEVRSRFKKHIQAGTENLFFLENMDTSGGGHGLGYPLMDTILHSLSLDPEESLLLISATRTLVLLRLPFRAPDSYKHT